MLVVDEALPETERDFRVDLIVTPDDMIWCQSSPTAAAEAIEDWLRGPLGEGQPCPRISPWST